MSSRALSTQTWIAALNGQYADMVKSHFMKLVHAYGSQVCRICMARFGRAARLCMFPTGVKVEIPLQSYFRLNAPGAGQFEHTLIIVGTRAPRSAFHRRLRPPQNTTWRICTPAVWSCLSAMNATSDAIRRSKTGRRTCITSIPSAPSSMRAA